MEILHDQLDILIIEDNPADLFLLKKMLRSSRLGIKNLYTADRIKDAQKLLEGQTVHLALLDLSLPDSFGIQSFLGIKSVGKKIPVIILTGLADANVALEAIKEGAHDYLVKGEFNEAVLSRAIQYSFERVKNEEEMKRQQQLKQQEITTAVLTAQEKERAMLGAELHDNINQILTGVTLFLNVAITNKEKREELLVKCRDNLQIATEEIRKLSRKLIIPSLKSQSLVQSLKDLVMDMQLGSPLRVVFDHQGMHEELLTDEQKLTLYRIAQEQLNNILKHAEASVVTILLYTDSRCIYMVITDDGKGFDMTAPRQGVGITNIISRVELSKGKVQINSSPGMGCSLKMKMSIK
jgi:signal transduction histidine kinase